MKDNLQIIIPTAKLVPEEMQRLDKVPPVVYPINDKTAFDYIYNAYNKFTNEFNLLCYERVDKISQQLQKYDKYVNLIKLDTLDDLGHTIYCGLKNSDKPCIINFADTILLDEINSFEQDMIFYTNSELSEKWSFFDIKDGEITAIYDKEENNDLNCSEKKLIVGVFYIKNTNEFINCLEQEFNKDNDKIDSFYRALMLYSKSNPIKAIETKNWFDIGHIDTYFNSQLEVKAREFNHINIDNGRGILTKTSDDKDKFIGEILWYIKLPKDIEYIRPRIFSYSTDYKEPYIKMEYYSYHTVHELFLYRDLNKDQWKDVFKRINFVYEDLQRYKVKDPAIQDALKGMYYDKTIYRLEKLKENDAFKNLFDNPFIVNGIKYLSLNEIINKLGKIIPENLYNIDEFSIIHGDLCFSNILIDESLSFVKVIDPRGKFGKFDIYGDNRYELAKLMHSVDGKYDFIIKDLFKLDYDIDNLTINFNVQEIPRAYNIVEIFEDVFKNSIANNLKEIELIEALLFLSMIPLHNENINHQLAMLSTGVEILNRHFDITQGE